MGKILPFGGGHFGPGPRQDKDSPPRDLEQDKDFVLEYIPMVVGPVRSDLLVKVIGQPWLDTNINHKHCSDCMAALGSRLSFRSNY